MTRRHEIFRRADEAPPERAAAAVHGATLLVVAALAWPVTSALFDTTNRPPVALGALRRAASPVTAVAAESAGRPLVVLLIDGLRADEAAGMTELSELARESAHAAIRLPIPTLSRPFYHAFLTGVPQAGTGVRTNRYGGQARLDSLADRVRDVGGQVALVANGLDWLRRMHGRTGDRTHASAEGFVRAAERETAGVARSPGAGLVVIHFTDVDKAGHLYGVRSPARRRALAEADALVGLLRRRSREAGAALAVLSDHGHIGVGGHGGDEEVVARVPFFLRDAGLARGRRPAIRVSEVAPILAARMGVSPPRSAIAAVPPTWAEPGIERTPAAAARANLLADATRVDGARLGSRRRWMLPLALLLSVAALGATKRAHRGFDRGTLLAPVLWAALVLTAHRYLFDRPFTLSAIDDVYRHGTRLALLGAIAAIVATTAATFLPRGRGARPPSPILSIRRSAAAVGWLAVVSMLIVLAWVGGALGPWPLGAHEYYLPVIAPAAGGGACLAAGLTLVLSAPFRVFTAPT